MNDAMEKIEEAGAGQRELSPIRFDGLSTAERSESKCVPSTSADSLCFSSVQTSLRPIVARRRVPET